MIKNKASFSVYSLPLLLAIIIHLVILFFIKKSPLDFSSLIINQSSGSKPLRINHIELIRHEDIEQLKRVGVKNGAKKDYLMPDMLQVPKPSLQLPPLSLGKLGANLPLLPQPKKTNGSISNELSKSTSKLIQKSNVSENNIHATMAKEDHAHFYFNPKKEKQIAPSEVQDSLKQEAYKNVVTSATNPVAQKMSNFEIRYERPEGVSEDELNSDEKAYYSFFKRSYASYLSKLYATYEKMSVERPGLEKDFLNKHLLIGKIDYDDKGNIITVKILKSSESDNVHAFFEETLKQLNLPNPPKSFIKSKKQFSTYYQIQIN